VSFKYSCSLKPNEIASGGELKTNMRSFHWCPGRSVSKTPTRLETKARSLTGPYFYRSFQSMLYKQREKWHDSLRMGHHETKNFNVVVISFKKNLPLRRRNSKSLLSMLFSSVAVLSVNVMCVIKGQLGRDKLHYRQGHPSSTRHSIRRNCPDQEAEANLAWTAIGDLLRSTYQMIRQSVLYGPFLLMTCKMWRWGPAYSLRPDTSFLRQTTFRYE